MSEGKPDSGWIENPKGAVDEEGNRRRDARIKEVLGGKPGEGGKGTGAPADPMKGAVEDYRPKH